MKKLISLMLVGLCVQSFAYAQTVQTSTDFWHNHDVEIPDYVDTDTDTTRNPFGIGPGLEVTLFESENAWIEEIYTDAEWDLKNREATVFFKAKVNAFRLLGGEKK